MGIPLTGSISSLARMGFVDLQTGGPNDGLSLLSDLIAPGGLVLAELGRDHFLLDEEIDITTVALAMTVIQWLDPPEPRLFPTPAIAPRPKLPQDNGNLGTTPR